MNAFSALYDLYEKNAAYAGEYEADSKNVLLPVGCTTANAQIEITLDTSSNMVKAEKVEKADATTIIFGSEDALGRTSGPQPFAIHDKLVYIARDYRDRFIYPDAENKKIKKTKAVIESNNFYLSGLEKWCGSPYCHKKAQIVYNYVKNHDIVDELIQVGIIIPDIDGMIDPKVKINGIKQTDAFVRFKILCENVNPEEIINDPDHIYDERIWLDKTLMRSYADYYLSFGGSEDLCYISGRRERTAASAARKIRNEGDGTKLICVNGSCYYTYRGRFKESSQAYCVGCDTSQKLHNALKWIIRRQAANKHGISRDGVCLVTWENNNCDLPAYYEDTVNLAVSDDDDEIPDVNAHANLSDAVDTAYITSQQFNRAVEGYKEKLDIGSRVYIMSLDSATPGRLAMTYFKELSGSRYLENIKN
ncbi:MAG: type I-C CRISPR-associated protein Cas8c/Csd1, partial [Eubacteriales bacterium]